ncbi:2-hydroxy-6-oxononadienedioate/2-hydroxy-6- oxononatrienedioate hydrolase 1 [Heracleum sosnowskyi]|uniref:2-hydroxy-6-oxononadienedioate/2-hydroxy-6-oxononatrienedioate hydrolase 1 n=1 Tax=Heracleum sosnowskyi TaxID=360622 RepID=A0AAD8HN47_9APIA|nr:2-hydroxy-6-oxononadienedioate/2-hydroxy-6- oxononatrienedioate hydrolase 1 [Heracleum sosnowskyi]
MGCSCLSFTSLYGRYLRRCLISAGLTSQLINIDNQTRIHVWGPKPNNSETILPKPAVLLIHGFGPQGMWQWRMQAVFLAKLFDVYMPDLVFFGESFTSGPERSEIFQAECMGKMMDKLGVESYSVVGTSYGGFVAYHMATMMPEKVDKVVIASSGVNMRLRDNQDLVKRANMDRIEDVMLPKTAVQLRSLMVLAVFRRVRLPDFFLNDFIETLYNQNRQEKLELLKGLTIGHNDVVRLSPLRQEALIIWGENDRIFLLEKAEELKDILGGNVKLEVIKNTAHVPQLEHPEEFNSILKNFLCGL